MESQIETPSEIYELSQVFISLVNPLHKQIQVDELS